MKLFSLYSTVKLKTQAKILFSSQEEKSHHPLLRVIQQALGAAIHHLTQSKIFGLWEQLDLFWKDAVQAEEGKQITTSCRRVWLHSDLHIVQGQWDLDEVQLNWKHCCGAKQDQTWFPHQPSALVLSPDLLFPPPKKKPKPYYPEKIGFTLALWPISAHYSDKGYRAAPTAGAPCCGFENPWKGNWLSFPAWGG